MSSATMELAETSPTAPTPRSKRDSDETLQRLFELSGRIIEWMQSRKDRVSEAYLTPGSHGWNLYVFGKTVEHDFQLSRELSKFVITLFDNVGEYLDPRLVPLSSLEEVKGYLAMSRALRLSPG